MLDLCWKESYQLYILEYFDVYTYYHRISNILTNSAGKAYNKVTASSAE